MVKSELVKKYRASAKDTGSVSVQVALLTDRIIALSKHLAKHIHDADSKRGLLIAVGKRRRLLNYVRGNDPKVYAKLIKDLKLKK
ncbi:MAG TPA: 30S ribosomal protein S15 [Patescibacteria group bacterium]|nr:30S ribosomal protein S15 [Patescibacteria group bacterium]